MRPIAWILVACLMCSVGRASAQSPKTDANLAARIDAQIDAALRAEKLTPASQADDGTIIRRLTLDLVGRIPTWQEVQTYTKSDAANKREQLVDRLINSPGFARYQAYLFDVMLSEKPGASGKNGSLQSYLQNALAENRGWDQIYRELMLPDEVARKGSGEFLRTKLVDADKLANEVSVSFFGVNVSCAQCHDHPLVKDWTQDHYYGMKSFVARTYDAGGFIGEREVGLVKFTPHKGSERAAKLMFLTGKVTDSPTVREPSKDDQKRDKEQLEQAKKAKTAPAAPSFSARAALVESSLAPAESVYFAKSIANRMWHRFFGTGLVSPLDQMHSENSPSHPALLSLLANDIRANKYDLKRFIRSLVMTQTYSRASSYPSAAHPEPKWFAIAKLKPLTPIQLATSLRIATLDPKQYSALTPAEFEKRIEQYESNSRGIANFFAQPTDNFQIGANEALIFSNNERLHKELLSDNGGTLLSVVKPLKTAQEQVATLIEHTLGRRANADESKALCGYLAARADRTPVALQQVLWALLSSPEFRFNY